MEKDLKIDYERMTATVSLMDGPFVLMVNEGKVRLVKLHEYGEFIAKTHRGKISHYAVTESGTF